MTNFLALSLLFTALIAGANYLIHCYLTGRLLTWMEWGEILDGTAARSRNPVDTQIP